MTIFYLFQAGIFYVTLFLVIGTSSLFFGFDCPELAMEVTPGKKKELIEIHNFH